MTDNEKQDLLSYVIEQASYSERHRDWEGKVVSDLSELPKGYSGEALHINDHGNVTLYRVFKNGNCREIASRV